MSDKLISTSCDDSREEQIKDSEVFSKPSARIDFQRLFPFPVNKVNILDETGPEFLDDSRKTDVEMQFLNRETGQIEEEKQKVAEFGIGLGWSREFVPPTRLP